jgi:hypothetical protein
VLYFLFWMRAVERDNEATSRRPIFEIGLFSALKISNNYFTINKTKISTDMSFHGEIVLEKGFFLYFDIYSFFPFQFYNSKRDS